MATSPAVATRVDAEAQKLLRYFDGITHCHVVIAAPHRHHRHGRHYEIHVELGVPGERLVINHEPSAHFQPEDRHLTKSAEVQSPHNDIYVVIREVFDSARRQLEDYVRRSRGDVKNHPSPTTKS
jgi:ribosome-associated translation inhibitor RaiA